MLELESEAFLLGNWKNVAEMEENLTLEELNMVVKAIHAREHRQNKFAAAMKGIKLDDGPDTMTAEDKVEELKRKAAGRAAGKTDDQIEFDELGLDIEVEE